MAVVVLGTLGYWVLTRFTALVLGTALAQRSEFLTPSQVGTRLAQVGRLLQSRLWTGDALVGGFTQGLLLLVLFGALAAVFVRARAWRRPRAFALFLGFLALVGVSVVWTAGLLLVLREFWPAPRVLSHIGILWGGLLAVWYLCSGRWARKGLAVLSGAIVLSFIGSGNHILDDQLRLNHRDALRANRIVARLEALPEFSRLQTVAVHGGGWAYPLGYRTVDHDMNISAFAPSWSKVSILRELSGYNVNAPADEATRAAAAAYCREARPWPAPESVVQRDRLAIVCLGK